MPGPGKGFTTTVTQVLTSSAAIAVDSPICVQSGHTLSYGDSVQMLQPYQTDPEMIPLRQFRMVPCPTADDPLPDTDVVMRVRSVAQSLKDQAPTGFRSLVIDSGLESSKRKQRSEKKEETKNRKRKKLAKEVVEEKTEEKGEEKKVKRTHIHTHSHTHTNTHTHRSRRRRRP